MNVPSDLDIRSSLLRVQVAVQPSRVLSRNSSDQAPGYRAGLASPAASDSMTGPYVILAAAWRRVVAARILVRVVDAVVQPCRAAGSGQDRSWLPWWSPSTPSSAR